MQTLWTLTFSLVVLLESSVLPQSGGTAQRSGQLAARPAPAEIGAAAAVEPGFVIGPEDVLGVLFWRDPDMSGRRRWRAADDDRHA
jgi:protein involved in polysaccharide export with SLBB domain